MFLTKLGGGGAAAPQCPPTPRTPMPIVYDYCKSKQFTL